MFVTNRIFIENNWLPFDNQINTKYHGEVLLPKMDDSLQLMRLLSTVLKQHKQMRKQTSQPFQILLSRILRAFQLFQA